MKIEELKKEWLFSNSLVAFAGAFLMARYSQLQDGTYQLTSSATVSALLLVSSIALAIILLVLSLFLAAAFVLPSFRSRAVRIITPFTPVLGLATLYTFTLTWISEFVGTPQEHWWRPFVLWAGLGMFLFILFAITHRPLVNMLRPIYGIWKRNPRPNPKIDADPVDPTHVKRRATPEPTSPHTRPQQPESRATGITTPAAVAVVGLTLAVVLWDCLRDNDK